MLAGAASAQAATCAFDPASGLVTVQLQGVAATLRVSGGAIELDGVACAGASTTNTARIVIMGLDRDRDELTLTGRFAPGRNDVPEDDKAEIEIEVLFGDPYDQLTVAGGANDDVWRFGAGGLNLNGDLDDDVLLPTAGRLALRPKAGNDTVDASLYSGACHLDMRGGDGDDLLTGSGADDALRGEAGDDVLSGGGGNDDVYDGPGADRVMGGRGADHLFADATADPGDDYHGGAGVDTVYYSARQTPLTISIDNVADDGQSGENDNVHLDVEQLFGGAGGDVLVGSSNADMLVGGGGLDELYGGGGDDTLDCGGGCSEFGGEGNDELRGSSFDDILDGGPGLDVYRASWGNDVIYNDDGFADTVDCGGGIDDPEPDSLDTFIGCEEI
jgi:Ca2+-binding RTX toxin-like protein